MVAVAEEGWPFVTNASDSSTTLRYLVTGTEDEAEAMAAAFTLAPAVSNAGFKKRQVSGVTQKGVDIWDIDVAYGEFKAFGSATPDLGSWNYTFDISTTEEHTYFGLSRVALFSRDPAKQTQWEEIAGNKINLSADGKVEGVPILIPTARFSLQLRASGGTITDSYKTQVEDLVGTVNNALFNRRAAGEVFFIGVNGQENSTTEWNINFNFAVRKNQTGLTLDGIPGINKEGWDYLWPLNRNDTDAAATAVVEKTEAYVVTRVYERTDFSLLGL